MYTSTVIYENKPETINFGVNTDHLGNVRAVVSDIRQPVDNDGDGETDEYQADVKFYADYYPFGMLQPGRSFNAGDYRFGFNGMEKLDEVTGVTGSHLDFGARIYDSRVGRWLSVDPLTSDYPFASPYNFALNTPIQAVDPDGKLVLFINGLRFNEAVGDQYMPVKGYTGNPEPYIYDGKTYEGPLRTYWTNDGEPNSFGNNVDIAQKYIDRFEDNNAYYLSGSSRWTSQASDREAEGAKKAEMFHSMVQSEKIELADDETIKIVSHSQGGAHSAGFGKKLMEYKDADGNQLYNIEVMYYVTPHQPTDIDHPSGIKGIQYSHPSDCVSSSQTSPLQWFNGGSEFGKIPNISEGNFVDYDILPGKKFGNNKYRGGHNVEDNTFIFDISKGQGGYIEPRKDKKE